MIYYVGGGSTREGHGLHLPSANGRHLCHIPDFPEPLDQHDRCNRFFKPEPHTYNNRDTQLPEQLSPISASRRSLLGTYTVSVVAHGIYITNTTTLSSTVLGGARANTSFGGQARPDEYRAQRARSPWSPGDVQHTG